MIETGTTVEDQHKRPRMVFGKDRHEIPYSERLRGGQEHNRTLAIVEKSIAEEGEPFLYAEELRKVALQFPDAPSISVIDGGCGYGLMLEEMRSLEPYIGKKIDTTGVTLEEEEAENLSQKDIDSIFIGSVQEYYKKMNGQKKFHFILDSHGAAYYDWGKGVEWMVKEGENIIPLYADLLYPQGRAFLSFALTYPGYGEVGRNNVLSLLERNNLQITREMNKGEYFSVQKRT